MDLLSQILSSRTKAGIFRFLFGTDCVELHARELARRTGMSLATIQQELKRLESLDLVSRRKDGNRVYFKANQNHPLFKELHQLTIKTSGIVPMLRNALQPQSGQIDYAFVFGSIARSQEQAHSDVDIMIIGHLGLRKAAGLIGSLTDPLEREINPHVQTLEEFQKRLEEGDPFIRNITIAEKLFIIGDENEFGPMAQKRMA
jgi:predicted nucleotidyltransferase/DNA-binding transcriptional ArsR family regulator